MIEWGWVRYIYVKNKKYRKWLEAMYVGKDGQDSE